ncbi:CHAT domain-containing protein [Actinoalloteichus hymeniacidonis]|uniref:CHAT domain n=1 Tax=Actinoalloteichus hymeniacidonis TaxID=340345 RepID=A0AAC9MXA9_9PSEU|nr:CHAT domain-containing protein [Actinoalloteichus hymeniacidonis]AOS61846.1 CHAT domain [Actinoalloteichus hymeniacidonis]MBB5910134.1 tetratricopeptide (TPR) repeat protein [Actinoalloteichus hymeniacidonis]
MTSLGDLIRAAEHGDFTGVLADDALVEAARVMLPAIGGSLPPEHLRDVAYLHWLRYHTLGVDDGPDLQVCMELFAGLVVEFPTALPPELLQWFRTNPAAEPTCAEIGSFYATVVAAVALTSSNAILIGLAIDSCRAAIRLSPTVDRLAHRYNLLVLSLRRLETTNEDTDLDEGIAAGAAAVMSLLAVEEDTSTGSAAPIRLQLGLALVTRFGLRGGEHDLTEGIDQLRAAAVSLPPDQPEYAACLGQLAAALQIRCDLGAPPAFTTEYVAVTEALGAIDGLDGLARGEALALRCDALRARFLRDGEPADIEESIRCGRAAVAGVPEDHELAVSARLVLVRALEAKFGIARAHGDSGGADPAEHAEALALVRRLDVAVPRDHPSRSAVDVMLASVLTVSDADSDSTETGTDPDGAIRAARAVLAGLPPGSPYRGTALFSLGNALRVRHQHTGEQEMLREAVEVLRAATEAGTAGPLGRTPVLTAFSMALSEALRRSDVLDDRADLLDEAIETTRAVIDDLPSDVVRGGQLWQLAELLAMRFEHTRRFEDLDEQIAVLRTAAPLAQHETALFQCLSVLANALSARTERTWNPSDHDEIATIRCRLVELLPEDDPALSAVQADAALALLRRFEIRGGFDDLARARTMARRAVAAAGDEHPHRDEIRGILAAALMVVAIPSRDVAGLTEAIDVCRAMTPEGGFPPESVAGILGRALAVRAEITGDTADLAAALPILRRLTAARVAGPSGTASAIGLVVALRSSFWRGGVVGDLTEAIHLGRSVLEEATPGVPDTVMLAAQVAAARSDRYGATRDPADIVEAITTLRSALRTVASDAPISWTFRLFLGQALLTRFRNTTQLADLAEAIELLRAGLVIAKQFGEDHTGQLMLAEALLQRGRWSDDQDALVEAGDLARAIDGASGLDVLRTSADIVAANALHLRFLDSGDPELLTEAIRIARNLIEVLPEGHLNHTHALVLLGTLSTLRFDRTGTATVIAEAVAVLTRAVSTASTQPMTASALIELANALRARQLILTESGNPDEVIAVAERGLSIITSGPSERAMHRTALASGLVMRFLRAGDLDDLNAAIDHCREAAAAPNARVSGVITLSTLGTALSVRFDRTGNVTDLHDAIEILREAARIAHAAHTMRPVLLTDLSNALRTRAAHLGSTSDLDAAVEAGRAAVDAAPSDYSRAPLLLMNLGAALTVRAQEKRDGRDGEAAITVMSQALARSGPGTRDRTLILVNLAQVLRTRRRRRSESDDLSRAVELLSEARAACDATHPLAPLVEFSFAMTLRDRYARDGREEDRIEAIERAERAIEGLDAGDPRSAAAVWVVGTLHEQRQEDEAAAQAYRTAAESPAAAPLVRAVAARLWAETAVRLRRWSEATAAFAVAVAELPQLAWHGIERGARERRLRTWEGLATEAAAAALSAGDPERAVELLEQGRSMLWSQALQTRDDFSVLRERDAALHDRLRAVATRLSATTQIDVPESGIMSEPWADRGHQDRFDRIRLAQDWDRLLAEARALPGLQYLLRIPPISTLRAELPDGPVVLINIERSRCDALIVRRDRAVEHVPLPALSQAEVVNRARAYGEALRVWERSGGSGGLTAIGARQTLHATLEWLWDTIAEPVLGSLGMTGADDPLPRLWWCPTGLLTLLPLHAAGYHDPADGPAGRTVLDRVVSSYTPTLRGLARANTANPPAPVDGRVLVVSLPDIPARPGQAALAPLPGARTEAEFFRTAFPNGHTLRTADTATRAAITVDLQTHAYAHFACHGGHDPRDPSTGALHLWDGPLTVLDVAELRLERAELAYLSACSTATGGTTLPDEAIHLAAALQLAGYRHVIATLWNIPDRTAPEVTATLYTALRDSGGLRLRDTARVLHDAVRALRSAAPRDPSIWAAHIHSGP